MLYTVYQISCILYAIYLTELHHPKMQPNVNLNSLGKEKQKQDKSNEQKSHL